MPASQAAPQLPEWLAVIADGVEPLAAPVRPAFEALLRAPDWAGWALFAFGVFLLLLGRHGQRLLMAVLCAAAVAWGAHRIGWGGKAGASSPPVAAACGGAAVLGAVLPSWTRGLALAGAGAALGQWIAVSLGVSALWAALPLAVLGFMVALVNERAFAIALPASGAGPALVAGLARSMPTEWRGTQAWLVDARVVLLASVIVASVLLAVRIQRDVKAERERKRRVDSGEDLKARAQREAQKAQFAAAAEKAKEKRTVH